MKPSIWQRGSHTLSIFGIIFAGLAASGAEQAEWLTYVKTAQAKAKAENKMILVDFTGSDWCGWCKKLKAEVFDQPEFIEFAKAHLVLVEIDFPRHKQLNPIQKTQNSVLAGMYHVQSYPTVVLLDGQNEQLGELGYLPGGPSVFIRELEKIAKLQDNGGNSHPRSGAIVDEFPGASKPGPAAPSKPAAAPVEFHYGALALKAISGGKERRMAMINNETFLVGETAKVRTQDQKVEVCCKEIREDSVLITADGKLMELKLANH